MHWVLKINGVGFLLICTVCALRSWCLFEKRRGPEGQSSFLPFPSTCQLLENLKKKKKGKRCKCSVFGNRIQMQCIFFLWFLTFYRKDEVVTQLGGSASLVQFVGWTCFIVNPALFSCFTVPLLEHKNIRCV
jgi:hypothetical protein